MRTGMTYQQSTTTTTADGPTTEWEAHTRRSVGRASHQNLDSVQIRYTDTTRASAQTPQDIPNRGLDHLVNSRSWDSSRPSRIAQANAVSRSTAGSPLMVQRSCGPSSRCADCAEEEHQSVGGSTISPISPHPPHVHREVGDGSGIPSWTDAAIRSVTRQEGERLSDDVREDMEFRLESKIGRTAFDNPGLRDRAAVTSGTNELGLQRALGNSWVAEIAEAEAEGDCSQILDQVNSGGAPLDTATRMGMEARLGHDFGDVRVHTDSQAHDSARVINAHAYTAGSHIVFQRGRYDPSSVEGRMRLAHELTHVVQQRSGPVDGTPIGGGVQLSDPSDRFEREAAHNAERAMSEPAPTTMSLSGLAVQREQLGQWYIQRQEVEEEEKDEDLYEDPAVKLEVARALEELAERQKDMTEEEKEDNLRRAPWTAPGHISEGPEVWPSEPPPLPHREPPAKRQKIQHPPCTPQERSGVAGGLIRLQRSAGNKAVVARLTARAPVTVQRQHAEEHARTEEEARALVDAHVVPRDCFIELKSTKQGWGPITGTGCAHWVAHQRGGPSGTTHVCQQGMKYRVTELLASLKQISPDLEGANVGVVWSAPRPQSHVGIVRAVTRYPPTGTVVSVEVENDSSASGGVVTQTKTSGSIYAEPGVDGPYAP